MPKYLIQGSYTQQGLSGLLKEGGSKRKEAVIQSVEKMGGTLEVYYFAFGSDDFFLILDLPSDVDMTAIALTAQATGTVTSKVTVLLTPEQVDEAVHKTIQFRAAGQ